MPIKIPGIHGKSGLMEKFLARNLNLTYCSFGLKNGEYYICMLSTSLNNYEAKMNDRMNYIQLSQQMKQQSAELKTNASVSPTRIFLKSNFSKPYN